MTYFEFHKWTLLKEFRYFLSSFLELSVPLQNVPFSSVKELISKVKQSNIEKGEKAKVEC